MRRAVILLSIALCAGAETSFLEWVRDAGGHIQTRPDGSVAGISLSHAWATDSDLEPITRVQTLEKLDLSLSLITDAGMERLKPLENVTELNLFGVEHITDTAIAYIRGWRKLQRLNLRGTDVTDTALEYIAQIPSLRSLDVSYTQVTNTGLDFLSSLPKLEELVIGGNKVTGAGLRVLKQLPSLRSLSLKGAQKRNSGTWTVSLTDLDLDALAGLKGLQSLDLAGLRISDAGVARLKDLTGLSVLDLSRTEVSASGLKGLRANRLKRLSLHRAKRVDDSIAEWLGAADRLEVLDLSETAVGDAGLARLAPLKSLSHVLLRGSKVTAEGVAAFRAALPGCQVSWQ
jgi:Leucine-rich repeat (LRR) protein